jgi:hypothetical protein
MDLRGWIMCRGMWRGSSSCCEWEEVCGEIEMKGLRTLDKGCALIVLALQVF